MTSRGGGNRGLGGSRDEPAPAPASASDHSRGPILSGGMHQDESAINGMALAAANDHQMGMEAQGVLTHHHSEPLSGFGPPSQMQSHAQPKRRMAYPLDTEGSGYYSAAAASRGEAMDSHSSSHHQDHPPFHPAQESSLDQQHQQQHPDQQWTSFNPGYEPYNQGNGEGSRKQQQHPETDKQQQPVALAPPPLLRNQACLSCRRRKMKCDAVRPVCGTCARSKAAAASAKHGAPVPPGPCVYEVVKPRVKATSSTTKRKRKEKVAHPEQQGQYGGDYGVGSHDPVDPNYVAELEERLRAMQDMVENQQLQQPPRFDGSGSNPRGRTVTEPVHHHSGGSNSGNSDHGMDSWARGSNGSGNGNGASLRTVPATAVAADAERETRETGSVPIFGMLQNDGSTAKRVRMQFHTRAMPPPASTSTKRRNSSTSNYSHLGPSPDSNGGMGTSGPNSSNFVRDSPQIPITVAGAEPDPLLEILFPGYPSDFPAPDTVHHLCEIFFSRCPLSSAIHKSTFMTGLSLPMRHKQRPIQALVHAIMAVAAPLSPYFEGSRPSVRKARLDQQHPFEAAGEARGSGRKELYDPRASSFAQFHLDRSQLKHIRALTQPHSPLDRCQSGLICAYILWGSTRFVEAFTENGAVQRTLLLTGLTRLGVNKTRYRVPAIIPPSSCDAEEQERRLLFWWCYITDVYNGGAGFMWEPMLDDKAIVTSLPASVVDVQAGREPKSNLQTLESPDLFKTGHIDDFSLHVKSCILLKKVYLLHSRTPLEENHLRKPQGFKAIETQISDFVQSFPAEDPYSPIVSVDRLLGWCNTQMALVLLHEPFISSPELECESYARVSVAVNATLAAVQKLCATSFDFGLLHPQLFLNWLVVGRMICKEIERQRRVGAPGSEAAPETLDALDMIISALYRAAEFNPCAARCFHLLQRFRSGKISEEMLAVCMYVEGLIPVDEDDILFPEDNLPSVPEALIPTSLHPGFPGEFGPDYSSSNGRYGMVQSQGDPENGFTNSPDPRSASWQAPFSNQDAFYQQQTPYQSSSSVPNPNMSFPTSANYPQAQQSAPGGASSNRQPPRPQSSDPSNSFISNANASSSAPQSFPPTQPSAEERYHSSARPTPSVIAIQNPADRNHAQSGAATFDDSGLPIWTLHYGDSMG